MTVLVVGATGRVGREVVAALQAKGETPRVLLRDPARRQHVPGEIEVAIGDLADPTSLDSALEGVSAAFLTLPHDLRPDPSIRRHRHEEASGPDS
jgi:uncharacterized protein YbjT (DUF2867 family)